MSDVAGGWLCSLLRTLGGKFWVGYCIFRYIWVRNTHLGCFGTRGEAGGGAIEFAMCSRSLGSQLGKWCQLGLGSELLLGSLGSVFHGKNYVL